MKQEYETQLKEKESKTRIALINKQKAALANEPALKSSASERRVAAHKPKNRYRKPLAAKDQGKEFLPSKPKDEGSSKAASTCGPESVDTESEARTPPEEETTTNNLPAFLIINRSKGPHSRLLPLAQLLKDKAIDIDESSTDQIEETMEMVRLLDQINTASSNSVANENADQQEHGTLLEVSGVSIVEACSLLTLTRKLMRMTRTCRLTHRLQR